MSEYVAIAYQISINNDRMFSQTHQMFKAITPSSPRKKAIAPNQISTNSDRPIISTPQSDRS
jgi:hypothetical protein